jgi:hypothetical protein
MDSQAHESWLLQVLMTALAVGLFALWMAVPVCAGDAPPVPSKSGESSSFPQKELAPQQAPAPQQPKLPVAPQSAAATASKTEPLLVTQFDLAPHNPIVLGNTTLGDFRILFEYSDVSGARSAISGIVSRLAIVVDDNLPHAVTASIIRIDFGEPTTQKTRPSSAKLDGQFTLLLKQGDIRGTFLGANLGENHIVYLLDPESGVRSSFATVEIRSSWYELLIIIAVPVGIVGYGYVGWWLWKRMRRRALESISARASPPSQEAYVAAPPPIPPLPVPEVPRQLLTALSEGRAMLVLGAGASAQAGYPTEEELLDQLLRRLSGRLPAEFAPAILTRSIGISRAMDALASAVPREQIATEIDLILDGVRGDSNFHEKLAGLPWHGVLSLTWDNFAEQIFIQRRRSQNAEWLTFSLDETAELPSAARTGQRLFLRPLGDLSRPATLSLSMEELRRNLIRRPEFQRQLALLLQTQCFLFIGVGRNTLEQFMLSVGADLEVDDERHFVLIADSAENGLLGATLKRFGLRLLPYSADPKHSAVKRFVDELSRSPHARAAKNARPPNNEFATNKVEGVTLKNIGLFDEITLKFQTSPIPPPESAAAGTALELSRKPSMPWTVIFGPNGCGKSSILRAIGLAFCGTEAQAAAGRLLQAGKSEGSIEVQFGSNLLRTRLVRDRNNVIVSVGQVSPVQGGLALVLGFPALRGAPSENPSGVAALDAHLPEPADLLPMINGEVDRRLGSFKQWLVNVLEQAGRGERRAVARKLLLDKIIRDVVPGEFQKLAPLDTSYIIRVKTDESDKPSPSDIPFDDLSQGMTSIFNWLGVLAQRMYDFYPDAEKPETQSAVVIVDEIDAHLSSSASNGTCN